MNISFKDRRGVGGVRSDLVRNNAHRISSKRKKRKVNISKRRRNGDRMVTEI